MKWRFLALVIWSVTGLAAQGENSSGNALLANAAKTFFAEKSRVEDNYRNALGDLVLKADKMEVFLLDFEHKPADAEFLFWDEHLEDDQFPIIPYKARSKILQRKMLDATEMAALRPMLREAITAKQDGNGPLCHFPIHGVRAWTGDTIVFQSSFCWTCKNFAISYPDNPAWAILPDGKLQLLMTKLLPIPESEIERLSAKYPLKRALKYCVNRALEPRVVP